MQNIPDSMAQAAPAQQKQAKRRPGRPSLSNEELLATALDLFFERGFEGTSIDAITSAAGMAKRTVYARYGDKTSLFKAALGRAIADWIVPVERLRQAETGDLEESLRGIGGILVANVLSPAGLRLMRLTNAESVRMPEISVYSVQRGTEPTVDYLADLFRRRLDLGNEAPEAAQAFLNIVVGGPASNAAWGMVIDPDALDRHVRYSVHLFLHGLLDGGSAGDMPADSRVRILIEEAGAKLAEAQARLDAARRLSGG